MRKESWDAEDRALAPSIRALTAEARRALDRHPATDELVAYHRKELSEAAAEALRGHLTLCPDCARRGLDLAAFVEPASLGEETAPAAEGWTALREELRDEGVLAENPGFLATLATPWTELAQLFGSLRFAYGLAALFLVTTLTLPWLVAERRVGGPRPNPQVVDLFPLDAVQRDVPAAGWSRIAAGDETLVFSLAASPGDLPTGASYRAEIIGLGAESAPRWSVEGLEPTAEGFFGIEIPGRALAAGRYGIEIHAAGPAGDRVVAEYRFEVEGS